MKRSTMRQELDQFLETVNQQHAIQVKRLEELHRSQRQYLESYEHTLRQRLQAQEERIAGLEFLMRDAAAQTTLVIEKAMTQVAEFEREVRHLRMTNEALSQGKVYDPAMGAWREKQDDKDSQPGN